MLTLRWSAIVLVTVVHAASLARGDTTLEELKAAASAPVATLRAERSQVKVGNEIAQQTEFLIDTGTRRYRLRYRTLGPKKAEQNGKLISDGCTGYGMVEPHTYWYHNGMVDVGFIGRRGLYTPAMHAEVRVLAETGPRVGYDLIFGGASDGIIIRTVALAGQEALFIAVAGQGNGAESTALVSTFRGYPHGYALPFDRHVHVGDLDIPNAGKEQSTTTIDANSAPWMLLCDHGKDAEGKAIGLLGLTFDRKGISKATVTHKSNYSIMPSFVSRPVAEQRFMLHTFTAMRREAALDKLAAQSDPSDLFSEAFDSLTPGLSD